MRDCGAILRRNPGPRQAWLRMAGGYLDIIFFALIAIFIILRLRSVLGRRTGHERQQQADHFSRSRQTREPRPGKVIQLPDRAGNRDDDADEMFDDEPAHSASDESGGFGEHERDSESGSGRVLDDDVRAGLVKIRSADPEFAPRHFLDGAKAAFEMIVDAFAKGDTPTLRPLLGDDVYDEFAAAIRDRLSDKVTMETRIVALESVDIVGAEMRGGTARVTIKFVSQQVNVSRNEAGDVVDGDPDTIVRVTDLWTFARNTRSSDPNWSLVETSAAD